MRTSILLCGFILVAPHSSYAQRDFYGEALAKYRAKQYQEALPAAQEAVLQAGDNAAHLHLYGLILQALNRLEPAEITLRKAAALEPGKSAFQYDLGYLLHQQRKYRDAVPVLKRAVELDPENLMARFMLARTYVFSYHELEISNFVELTLEQLNYIVKRNARFPAVHHHLALVYINSGEHAKALEELSTELLYYPENIQARMELGETLLRLNRYHKAAEELLIAGKQSPQIPGIHYALAKAYRADHQTTKALDAARRCVELAPQFADGHYLLGQLYRDTGKSEQAREHFEHFRRLKNSTAPAPDPAR